jgi:citrate lyase subunit beta/citryl-CoA lyase
MILRTLLFVPGNQERRIEKARSVVADALILDLEDSVPPSEKDSAREMVAVSIEGLASNGKEVFVRTNSLSTSYAIPDIKAVVRNGLRGIMLPKSESAESIQKAANLIVNAEKENNLEIGSTGILALVETPRGIINVHEIARASSRIIGITIGAEDYALEMGINRTREGDELYYPRTVISLACHAADILAIDSVYTDVRDTEGLTKETQMAKQMGFQGKLVIHPDQVEPVNQVFVPSSEEISHAQRVLEVYETAVSEGKASTSLDGRMVDAPVAAKAKKLLVLAESIARKENDRPM